MANLPTDTLVRLAETIASRRDASPQTSYTAKLLGAGAHKCAKKFGEEAFEFALAAVDEDDASVKAEAADVLYHMLVLLESRNLAIADVLDILADRTRMSGLEEKASRG